MRQEFTLHWLWVVDVRFFWLEFWVDYWQCDWEIGYIIQNKNWNFYIAYVAGQPVGCMAITDEDKKYWKEDKAGEALYLHKLAVKQNFRGMGISSELINYAKKITIISGIKSLKLDCNADRLKLRNIYQNKGFELVETIYMDNNYKMALYVMDVT